MITSGSSGFTTQQANAMPKLRPTPQEKADHIAETAREGAERKTQGFAAAEARADQYFRTGSIPPRSKPEAKPREQNGHTADLKEEKPQGKDRLAKFVFSGDEPPAPQTMLIDGVMPLQGLPFIGGQSSAGKTFIAVMLACCAATGKPFMGREVKSASAA